MRNDKTLGLTPLSIEVPYSDSAVEYQFKKAGYENKTVYVVPNLPSPLFATLRKVELPATDGAGGTLGARRKATATGGVRRQRVEKPPLHTDDEDGVLEPSFNRVAPAPREADAAG